LEEGKAMPECRGFGVFELGNLFKDVIQEGPRGLHLGALSVLFIVMFLT
jgi:hypothetical protein